MNRLDHRPVVETTDAGRQFAITRAEPGGGTIRWSYRLEPDAAGTTVTLSYDVLRPVPGGLHLMLRLIFGVRDPACRPPPEHAYQPPAARRDRLPRGRGPAIGGTIPRSGAAQQLSLRELMIRSD